MVIEDLEHVLHLQKSDPMYSFATRGCCKFGDNCTPLSSNPHNPLSESTQIIMNNPRLLKIMLKSDEICACEAFI